MTYLLLGNGSDCGFLLRQPVPNHKPFEFKGETTRGQKTDVEISGV